MLDPMTSRLRRRTLLGASAAGAAGAVLTGGPTTAAARPAGRPARGGTKIDPRLTRLFGDYADTAGRWTGADSAYSVPLSDGRTAWLYSDTFLGAVNADHSRPADSPFIHNSIIIESRAHRRGGADDHGQLTTHTAGTPSAPRSLVSVAGADEDKRWYWFGDGTVEGDRLRVLLIEFVKTGDGPFDFSFVGTAVASFSLPDLRLDDKIHPLPDSEISWASAILESGPYTYIYGVEDLHATKYAHLARVRRGGLVDRTWQYFDGRGWSRRRSDSARIITGVANEFSVQRLGAGYGLVTSDAREELSADILLYRGPTPMGPFTDPILLYRTPETSGNIYTYNAKSHPRMGSSRELAISYNVNSLDTDDVYADVDNYRPRYLRARLG